VIRGCDAVGACDGVCDPADDDIVCAGANFTTKDFAPVTDAPVTAAAAVVVVVVVEVRTVTVVGVGDVV